MTAFILLIPLAITSTKRMVRWLGGKRWQMLHRLIYVSAVAGVIHYFWLVKADLHRPVRYGVILGVLLSVRTLFAFLKRHSRRKVMIGRVVTESD